MVALSKIAKPYFKNKRIVALDPGETTGACVFYGNELVAATQLVTKPLDVGIEAVHNYIHASGDGLPDLIVYEDYRVYGWKSEQHKWADLHTPKLIGSIEAVAYYHDIPTESRLAQQAKQFVTDDRLKEWGLWQTGKQHARDAIRHAVYQVVHGDVKKLEKVA